jgi:hypothetical protein
MAKLYKKIKHTNSFLLNDGGKLVEIKQPTIMDLSIFYQAIMANKKVINTIFSDLQ